MRLRELKVLSDWKNLKDFSIDFDSVRDLTVIIGRNGSAKSNFFELLIKIFADLAREQKSDFAYELKYDIKGHEIYLTSLIGERPKATSDGKSVSLKDLVDNWIPEYIVAYYSGFSDRFSQIFAPFDRLALRETLVNSHSTNDQSFLNLRRFIYAREEHSFFLLLIFYFAEDKKLNQFLKEVLRIDGFDSALITIRKPRWANRDSTAENFWGASGPVLDLLLRLREYSVAPVVVKQRVEVDFARSTEAEFIYLYLPDVETLMALAADYGHDANSIFQALDTMRLSDLIEDFKINVKIKNSLKSVHSRQLSEGEQQLITVLGLLRFTRKAESLYLLDEPDTHLNPSWSVSYIDYLRDIGGIARDSHTIISTHNPLLVASLCKEEIRVLNRSNEGIIYSTIPKDSPRGTGIAAVLTSPLYGLESQLDNFTLSVLRRIYEVSQQEKTERRNTHLRRLRKLIPSLNAIESSPDPYRNIAREAYRLAHSEIKKLEPGTSLRIEAADRLAEKLYEEVIETE